MDPRNHATPNSTGTTPTPSEPVPAVDNDRTELRAAFDTVYDALSEFGRLISEADDALEPLQWRNDDGEFAEWVDNLVDKICDVSLAVDSAERALELLGRMADLVNNSTTD